MSICPWRVSTCISLPVCADPSLSLNLFISALALSIVVVVVAKSVSKLPLILSICSSEYSMSPCILSHAVSRISSCWVIDCVTSNTPPSSILCILSSRACILLFSLSIRFSNLVTCAPASPDSAAWSMCALLRNPNIPIDVIIDNTITASII